MIDKIKQLKKERNAVILAHNYQLPEVQDIADFVGDSLELSRKAADIEGDVIVFCGVRFMAETAKILSPEKTVLIPDEYAGCPMANMITGADLREFKSRYLGAAVVCYVNTTAEVKAESDICCTSANAIKVVESVKSDTVLFVPDKSLGSYVKQQTKKNVIPYTGFCPTHHRITEIDVVNAKRLHPDALVVAHPECWLDILKHADAIESTGGMLRYIRESDCKEFILCTERGMIHRLKKENPDKEFYNPCPLNICPNMKKITLEKVLAALEDNQYEVTLDRDVSEKARAAIERMLEL